ncbi:hypothetical protein FACS189490_06330 [Clostridia bacterium]|nr:hypothetical protein FACS189490_06330 [Clostridia bacterium]
MKDKKSFAIVLQGEDRLIGSAGLMNYDGINRTAELGVSIGEAADRSKGYGLETVKLILRFGFDALNLNSVVLRVFEFNVGAIKCYERAGFVKSGVRRQAYYAKGKYYDQIYMDILREEWLKLNGNN